ncbi:MAG: GNAT family N-acetyltransferase [Acidobacteria bacterium]|nr:GNAT family N-acetyltransferase [Acidobacteriota bacterium]
MGKLCLEMPAALVETTRHAAGDAWQRGLPVLRGLGVTLREPRLEDAPALLAHLGVEEVGRFMTPPPSTVEGFAEFIARAQREREAGQYACFAVVPEGATQPVGVFQLRCLDTGFAAAEWAFAIGPTYWGTGLFMASARLLLAFAFEQLGVLRLEGRAAVMNGRGNGALRKAGAVQEGVLRRAFQRNQHCYDQVLWSILAEDWRLQRSAASRHIH